MSASPSRISIFDIFKVGVGPSSSHTLGPWLAALELVKEIDSHGRLDQLLRVQCTLMGSLALTGHGHCTHIAILCGLSGLSVEKSNSTDIQKRYQNILQNKLLLINGKKACPFDLENDLHFDSNTGTPIHPNTMVFQIELKDGAKLSYTYYSLGGGFIKAEHHSDQPSSLRAQPPHPCQTAQELLDTCQSQGLSIPELIHRNEIFWHGETSVTKQIELLWETMTQAMLKSIQQRGELPGGLKVQRRAHHIYKTLSEQSPIPNKLEDLTAIIDRQTWSLQQTQQWISCFALAINEENACMGRIVTSPTNGAAGIVPAVLLYAYLFEKKRQNVDLLHFFLCAGEIGTAYIKGATISAAAGGCQAEIGVSSSMAAAGLAQLLGASPEQVCTAAEIAMEHHLGLTCDPVAGLVQIPCIERNAIAAHHAISSAHLALISPLHQSKVSLDQVIRTMWKTGQDMDQKYKETSRGGLAVSVRQKDC